MVTLVGLTRTLRTTKRPYSVLFMKFSKKAKLVTFKNDSEFRVFWPQYRILRDHYSVVQKYAIEQVKGDLFKIELEKFALVAPLPMACLVGELGLKYDIEQVENDLFRIKSDKFELIGSSEMMHSLRELQLGEYECNCLNKTVLDVGGFQGESGVFFSAMGAKKVIIYEPVIDHHSLIRRNVTLNRVNAEIHEEGIGVSDGTQIIRYDKTDVGFGSLVSGQFEMKIRIRNVTNVIEESGADIAKFDCEGAEKSIVHVPSETLRRIELYLIETHCSESKKAIIKKFKASGFTLVKETVKNAQVSVVFLKRKD